MKKLFLVCVLFCGCVGDVYGDVCAEFDLEVERIRGEEACLRKELRRAEEFLDCCGDDLSLLDRCYLLGVIEWGYGCIVDVPDCPSELENVVRVKEYELVRVSYVDVCKEVRRCVMELRGY